MVVSSGRNTKEDHEKSVIDIDASLHEVLGSGMGLLRNVNFHVVCYAHITGNNSKGGNV